MLLENTNHFLRVQVNVLDGGMIQQFNGSHRFTAAQSGAAGRGYDYIGYALGFDLFEQSLHNWAGASRNAASAHVDGHFGASLAGSECQSLLCVFPNTFQVVYS
jgi:hypothetical protein